MTDGENPRAEKAAPEAGEPAIDWAYLSRQTMGDVALEAELLALFETQAAEFCGKLAAAASDKARLDLVHTLKGAARAIGAFALGDAAEDYESALSEARDTGARDMGARDTGARDTGTRDKKARDTQTRLEARLGEARQAIFTRLERR
jgi:HPt (histidine-containing phosphotransfer) domain-containing protein